MKWLFLASALLLAAKPALAQQGHEGHGVQPPVAATPLKANDPHAGHDMGQMKEPPPTEPAEKPVDPQAGHDIGAMPSEDDREIGSAPAPAPPTDHAADALYGADRMAPARKILYRDNGYFRGSMILFDLAEFQARKGGDGYRWEGEAWFGGDLDKLLVKSEGEGTFGKPVEKFEVQALYSRAVAPYWNAHVGVRHDIVPNPSRTYAVVGIEGVAPYWFHLTGQLFLSNKGEFRARAEGSYDWRLTQRLVLTPRAELNFSAQDIPLIGVGSGLEDVELGARLRYDISKKFAPYVGVEWARKVGDTARYARAAGEDASVTNFVAGIRFWF